LGAGDLERIRPVVDESGHRSRLAHSEVVARPAAVFVRIDVARGILEIEVAVLHIFNGARMQIANRKSFEQIAEERVVTEKLRLSFYE
jgi:hypothetical protein